MSDYIKTKEYKFPDGETVTAYFDEYGIAKITIQALDAIFDNFINSADRVEVVRCKDCRWYEINELKSDGTEDKRYKPSMCVLHSRSFRDNYYCADGERAEE